LVPGSPKLDGTGGCDYVWRSAVQCGHRDDALAVMNYVILMKMNLHACVFMPLADHQSGNGAYKIAF